MFRVLVVKGDRVLFLLLDINFLFGNSCLGWGFLVGFFEIFEGVFMKKYSCYQIYFSLLNLIVV